MDGLIYDATGRPLRRCIGFLPRFEPVAPEPAGDVVDAVSHDWIDGGDEEL